MSDSVPSESSAADLAFSVGVELVQVTRADQSIFLAPDLRWSTAGHEEGYYGAPLDRLFGEDDNAYITGAIDPEDLAIAIAAAGSPSNDPLVTLPGFTDAAPVAFPEEAPLHVGSLDELATLSADTLHTAEFVTLFDFDPGAHSDAMHLHEAWTWDIGRGAWVFDHHS